jgi:predicted lipase
VATNRRATIIAFAGTDPLNLPNWISDFYLGRSDADIHKGFRDAAATVWPDVGTVIQTCAESNRQIFIVGHSLGAAIAIVTADRASSERNLRQAEIYVFGAPRAGKLNFVNRYNANFGTTTYRFVTVPISFRQFHRRNWNCPRARPSRCGAGPGRPTVEHRNDIPYNSSFEITLPAERFWYYSR